MNSTQMRGVPVRTQAHEHIGKLASVDFDSDTGRLLAVCVKVSRVIPALFGQEARVAWSQIISLSEEEVVVRDGVVFEQASWSAVSHPIPSAPVSLYELPADSSDA